MLGGLLGRFVTCQIENNLTKQNNSQKFWMRWTCDEQMNEFELLEENL